MIYMREEIGKEYRNEKKVQFWLSIISKALIGAYSALEPLAETQARSNLSSEVCCTLQEKLIAIIGGNKKDHCSSSPSSLSTWR